MPSCLACSCLCWASSSIQSEKRNCGKNRQPRRKPKPGQTVSFGVTLLGSKRQSETRRSRWLASRRTEFLLFQFGAQNDRSYRHFGRQHRASDRVLPKGAGPAWLRNRHGSVGGGERPRRRHCLRCPWAGNRLPKRQTVILDR